MDFQRAPELDLHTDIPDPEVLRLCAEENRILVTHDRHSMPAHFIAFIQQQDSPGVLSSAANSPSAKQQNGCCFIGQPVKPANIKTKLLTSLSLPFALYFTTGASKVRSIEFPIA
jgi:hypothetical protein